MNEQSIAFSHLGIFFHRVGKTINLFGLDVTYYGIVISAGMVLAGAFVLYDGCRKKQKQDDYLDVLIWGLIVGIIGARAYYVIFSWDDYRDNLISILAFRQGGLAIYGGILGGIIGAIITCRVKKLPFFDVADSVCMGLLIGQSIGRWGNFFNREAFGGYSDGVLSMQIPVDAVRSMDDVTSEMMAHLVEFDGVSFISVHPTFLYESLWNLGVFLILFFLRRKRSFFGEIWFMYMALYGVGRFWIESLRTDSLRTAFLGLRVSQMLSLILIVISAVYLIYGFSRKKGEATC
ncbi:MAG: prolipoprotein diacylglyceryl transferase [Lachnospiraceae bacterium]|nr:prolipoprotein diacylglyceryl transferase [Lachnospiraceae bacterium]